MEPGRTFWWRGSPGKGLPYVPVPLRPKPGALPPRRAQSHGSPRLREAAAPPAGAEGGGRRRGARGACASRCRAAPRPSGRHLASSRSACAARAFAAAREGTRGRGAGARSSAGPGPVSGAGRGRAAWVPRAGSGRGAPGVVAWPGPGGDGASPRR